MMERIDICPHCKGEVELRYTRLDVLGRVMPAMKSGLLPQRLDAGRCRDCDYSFLLGAVPSAAPGVEEATEGQPP